MLNSTTNTVHWPFSVIALVEVPKDSMLAQIEEKKISTGTVLSNHHSKYEESTNPLTGIFPGCRKEHASKNS